MRWDAIESPGDDSPYVSAARTILAEAAPRSGSALDRSQFGFFCDKMARMFVPRFIDTIYRLRKYVASWLWDFDLIPDGIYSATSASITKHAVSC